MAHRKRGGGGWKESVKHAIAVPSLPIIGHALRNDLQTAASQVLWPNQTQSLIINQYPFNRNPFFIHLWQKAKKTKLKHDSRLTSR